MIKAGTKGRIKTHHKSDGDYSSAVIVARDCPADSINILVRLLEDWYCLSAGDEIKHPRRLFQAVEAGRG